MRTQIFALCLFLLAAVPSPAEPRARSADEAAPAVDHKTRKQVEKMEQQLQRAFEKRDTAILATLLADRYFDAYEAGERALDKNGTIARCKAGLLGYLEIEKDRKLGRDKEAVTVTGLARLKSTQVDDVTPPEKWIGVKRFWTKKDGRWVLERQLRRSLEED